MGYKRIHWVLIGNSCMKINRLTLKSCFEILRNLTKDSCALSLSFYHLLSKFADSLDPDDRRRFAGPDLGQTRIPYLFASLGTLIYFKEKKISDKYHESTFSLRCMQCSVSSMCQPAQFKLDCQRT